MNLTLSERIFQEKILELGFEIRRIPESPKSGKAPDFEIITHQSRIIAEVKEITANDEDVKSIKGLHNGETVVHSSVPGERVRRAIRSGSKQLRAYGTERDVKLLVVMQNIQFEGKTGGFVPMFYTASSDIDIAMFGFLTVTASLGQNKSVTPDHSGKGRTTTKEEKNYLSAICVISDPKSRQLIFYHNPFAVNPLDPNLFYGETITHFIKPEPVFERPLEWQQIR